MPERTPFEPVPHFHWWLPTVNDGHHIVALTDRVRKPEIGYLIDVARAAERNGFESLLIPVDFNGEEPVVTAAAVAGHTSSIGLLVAVRPGFISPTYMAHMAATVQRYSGDRLHFNIVTGGDDAEQRSHGDFLAKADRYRRTREFITVLDKSWSGEPFDFDGDFYQIQAGLGRRLNRRPTLFFGGASPEAAEVAAHHADVQLLFGEPPAMAATRVDALAARAHAAGRHLEFGIRLHVISRNTAQQAWAEANELLDAIPDELIEQRQSILRASNAAGQQRMSSINPGSKSDRAALEIAPNIWAGTGLVMSGGGSALVGSHGEVAARIREYLAVGINHFILSGYPKLESVYTVGENVLPHFTDAFAGTIG